MVDAAWRRVFNVQAVPAYDATHFPKALLKFLFMFFHLSIQRVRWSISWIITVHTNKITKIGNVSHDHICPTLAREIGSSSSGESINWWRSCAAATTPIGAITTA
jgi:hypothetical protein